MEKVTMACSFSELFVIGVENRGMGCLYMVVRPKGEGSVGRAGG